jgi:hypothetical protein
MTGVSESSGITTNINYERHKPSSFLLAAGQALNGKVSQIADFQLTGGQSLDLSAKNC